MTAPAGPGPLLSLRGVNKSFGAVHVLQEVDLDVHPGEVTALVGDDGAGKSTLIKGTAGIYAFDSGSYTFEGQSVHVTNPKQANALGIEVVYQDLALCDNLDIVHNLFLGREITKGGRLDEATSQQLTEGMKDVLQKYGDGDFAAANRKLNQLWALGGIR